jgi:hypothetical protein
VALILEVLDARSGGVRTRLRIESLPFTLGRALDNDLILDDPYVDPHHARIADAGELGAVLEDLGSLNGIVPTDADRRLARVPARPGTEVRIGRTLLRFRDTAEPVPPALPYNPAGPAGNARWLSTTRGRAAISTLAVLAVAATLWLGSYERNAASDVFGGVLAFFVLASIWAGIWAVASRIVVHRFHFLGHFAVVSAITLAGLAYSALVGWIDFLFPDNPLSDPAGAAAALALIASTVAGHLALASNLSRRRRWRAGFIAGGAVLAIAGLAALAEGDTFSDIPEFPTVLKPIAPRWLPTIPAADFADVAAELKLEVDRLAVED